MRSRKRRWPFWLTYNRLLAVLNKAATQQEVDEVRPMWTRRLPRSPPPRPNGGTSKLNRRVQGVVAD